MSFANYQQKTTPMLMLSGLCGALILSGCASKPTYHGATHTQNIIKNSRGVPNRYMVQQGDTVSKIAERYGLDWREIGRINQLNAQYTIYTGQWLLLWQANQTAQATPVNQTKVVNGTVLKPQTTTASTTITPAAPKPVTQVQPVVVSSTSTLPAVTKNPLSIGSVGVGLFKYPVARSNKVDRSFGHASVYNGQQIINQGMWFTGRSGDVIMSVGDGTVIRADGNMDNAMISIQHANGFVSHYIHIQNAQVRAGQNVKTGQQIATMRPQANGVAVFELRMSHNASYIDPASVMRN